MRVLFISSGNKTGNGLPIIQNQAQSLRKEGVEVDHYLVIGRGITGYLKNIPTLRKQMSDGHYDVVHAHYAFNAYLANLTGLRPLVVSVMGSDIQHYAFLAPLARVASWLFRWNAIIVKSQEMKHRLNVDRAMVIPNGVDMDTFCEMDQNSCRIELGWNPNNLHVLFPGNPNLHRKNWPLAEAAVKRLNDAYRTIPNAKRIELHPMVDVPNDKTPILYNAADAAILPSFYEGSANALKEAMACGCPIVATPCGDAVERLKNVSGSYASKTYEVEEVAGLLKKSLQWQGKTNGRDVLRQDNLDAKQVANTLIEIYTKVIKGDRI